MSKSYKSLWVLNLTALALSTGLVSYGSTAGTVGDESGEGKSSTRLHGQPGPSGVDGPQTASPGAASGPHRGPYERVSPADGAAGSPDASIFTQADIPGITPSRR